MSNLRDRIRPAARHILTIGEGIIKDYYTAIIELVKNAYDADATEVNILFDIKKMDNKPYLKIVISDNGHGMDVKTIEEKWLVPSTDNKLKNPKSKFFKRNVQGKKGIGRYAVSILGDNFSLVTTDKVTLETCTIVIDWQDFKAEGKFLDEVPVLTEITTDTRKTSGTTLEILTDKFWSPIEINSLILELRKLLPPDLSLPFEVKDPTIDEEKDIFKISLFLKDLNIDFKNETFNDKKVNIESIKRIIDDYSDDYRELKPAPIIDYFHYRIHGSISKVDGKLIPNLTFVNNYDGNNITKTISTKPIAVEGNCGLVKIDLRVFDGDKEGLGIIGSHLGGTYKSKEIQNILYEFAGVRVYKDKFRVRPYGGAGDDWLGLGTRRLSTPTERISSNQIIGLVWVEPEEKSGLEEKATREGFKDSQSFDTLKKIILIALSELEGRRLDFRIKAKKGGRSKDRTQENIDKTKEFDTLLEQIKDLLKDLPSDAQQKIEELIQVKAQQVSNTLEEVERMISVYQSKIMLGKMVAYLFHEGRPHLTSIKSKSRHVDHYIKKINQEISVLDIKHAEILTKNLDDTKESMKISAKEAQLIIELFDKLQPLAAEKRKDPQPFVLKGLIQNCIDMLIDDLEKNNIKVEIDVTEEIPISILCWDTDIQYSVFRNLLDNSIFWIGIEKPDNGLISIKISIENDKVVIDYKDNGTGIDDGDIESNILFDPGFSKKPEGTGLGLSIAGEATERNKGVIQVLPNEGGAHFQLKFPKI